MLSLTVSKLSQIIHQICNFNREYLSSTTHSFGVNLKTTKFDLWKVESSPYREVQNTFRYL